MTTSKSLFTEMMTPSTNSVGVRGAAGDAMVEVDVVPSNGKTGAKTPKQSAKWTAMFSQLEAYRKDNGNCLVPRGYPPNKKLATWVAEQRKQYKLWCDGRASKMTQDRIRQLESIGFSWSAQEAAWDRHYEELKQFKKEYGHCMVPVNFAANPSLGCWIKEQRRHYNNYTKGKPSHMTTARIQKLESVGFCCDTHEAVWWERFEELKKYKSTHGHCMVPTKTGGSLGAWVHHQRRQYRKMQSSSPSSLGSPSSSMTQSRIEALNSLGFCWSPRGNTNETEATSESVPESVPAFTPTVAKVEPERQQSSVVHEIVQPAKKMDEAFKEKEAVKVAESKPPVVEPTPDEVVPVEVKENEIKANASMMPRHSLMLQEDCLNPIDLRDWECPDNDADNMTAVFLQFCFGEELASMPSSSPSSSIDDNSVSTADIDNILNTDDDDVSLFSLLDEQELPSTDTPTNSMDTKPQLLQTRRTSSSRSKKTSRKLDCDDVYPWDVACDGRAWSKKQKSVNDWRFRRTSSAIFSVTFESILRVQLVAIQEEVQIATLGAVAASAA